MSEITLRSVSDYRATYGLIKERIEGLTPIQLEWKPAANKWSVKEVLAHLVDSSLAHSIRIRQIIAGNTSQILLYEQDAWVANAKSNETNIEDILSAFQAILLYNALFYERLSEEDWTKKGVNGDKEVSIADLFQGFISHVNIHLAQIDRNKAALAAQ
jgi:hypothetical protein